MVLTMIQPLSASTTAVSAPPSTKPWAPGDESSFAQLFNPIVSASAAETKAVPADTTTAGPAATTPAATTPAATTPAAPTPAASATPATPFTFEQNVTVDGFTTSTPMNPEELATADTANALATMLGGKVVNEPDYGGGWSTSVPTRDIAFTNADGSQLKLNAGILAYLFNNYGEAPGSQAWQQVNQALGRDLMSTTPKA